MHWYEGSIAEAVTASKKKEAVFVVYTEGKDDTSKKLTSLIDSDEVSSKLGSEHFVAIKIEANTLPHQQFSEIYKQVTVPSVFFIGKNGMPAEIIKDAKDSSDFVAKIDSVLKKCGFPVSSKPSSEKPSTSEQKASSPPPNVVCENGVCTIQKSPPASVETSKIETNQGDGKAAEEQKPEEPVKTEEKANSESSANELSSEEKVQRAKELIELQRQQKQKEEEEKEKQKELERRKMGQGVQQLKKWQEDQELKQLMEEREKERRDNKAARDRVLAQIAQDKAERAVRFSSSPPAQIPVAESPPAAPRQAAPADPSSLAKLQFRLPDGATHTREFRAADTLEQVRAYVAANLSAPADFALATAFPRRQFTVADGELTLADLLLVPNAVVLVLRASGGAVVTAGGGGAGWGLTSLVWMLFAPVFGVLGFLRSFLFGAPAPQQASSSAAAAATASAQDGGKRQAQEQEPHASNYQQKRLRESTVIRRQGNIARLSDRTDSDDENNTWNGNSTQQM